MIKRNLLHIGHKMKLWLKDKPPFLGRGVLLNLADKMIGKPVEPIIVKTLYGFKMQIDPVNDKGVERSIFYTGTYEAGVLRIFDKILKPGDKVLDVGANIGLMTLFAANRIGSNGEVHSFEPEPDTFTILSKNVLLNKKRNIRLNNVALGAEEKEGIIYPNFDVNRGASSIVKKDTTVGKPIKIVTLDQYLQQKNLSKISLIKIDIEGYELEMLKGGENLLKSEDAPIICIEYSQDVEHVKEVGDVYDYLKNINNYRFFKFTQWKGDICNLIEVHSKNEMPKHDNVFCFLPNQLSHIDKSIFE